MLPKLTRVVYSTIPSIQVDSWLTDGQHQNFERWQLAAVTYLESDGWRRLFDEVGYTGDYYWTMTE